MQELGDNKDSQSSDRLFEASIHSEINAKTLAVRPHTKNCDFLEDVFMGRFCDVIDYSYLCKT